MATSIWHLDRISPSRISLSTPNTILCDAMEPITPQSSPVQSRGELCQLPLFTTHITRCNSTPTAMICTRIRIWEGSCTGTPYPRAPIGRLACVHLSGESWQSKNRSKREQRHRPMDNNSNAAHATPKGAGPGPCERARCIRSQVAPSDLCPGGP